MYGRKVDSFEIPVRDALYQDKITIVRFRDGDTLEGFLECGHCRTVVRAVVRLPFIESWELSGGDSALARTTADKLTDIYRGRSGLLATAKLRRDQHDRVVADVLLEGISLASTLVKLGYAWSVDTQSPHKSVLKMY
jgi:endonuclease YncB( thermonuclease family)